MRVSSGYKVIFWGRSSFSGGGVCFFYVRGGGVFFRLVLYCDFGNSFGRDFLVFLIFTVNVFLIKCFFRLVS